MDEATEYEVHLTDGETIATDDRLDFYDSGVWVAREEGRDFYPYARIEVIRERPTGDSDASSEGASVEDAPSIEEETDDGTEADA